MSILSCFLTVRGTMDLLLRVALVSVLLVSIPAGYKAQVTPSCGIWGMPCPRGPCGGFTCGEMARCSAQQRCECLPGYGRPCTNKATAVISCTDIDECSTGEHRCPSSQSRCENYPGGYRCVPFCKSGYGNVGTGAIGTPLLCRDINECVSKSTRDSCGSRSRCENTLGSFRCTCLPGYAGDGASCQDIDECRDENVCHPQARCVNTDGSYTCTCKEGFEGDGQRCVRTRTEEDDDECLQEGVCHPDAMCINTMGSYLCWCRRGYTGNGLDTCEDIDECQGSNPCNRDALCANTAGSFQCACAPGYIGDGINACTVTSGGCGVDICHVNADCVSGGGNFTCQCAEGYSGDGLHECSDIDECVTLGTSACGQDSTCTNTNGSFNCSCVGDSCSGVNIGSTEIAFNDRTLEYFGIGVAILASIFTALILGWLIRRKRRRQSSLTEENPADNPAVDTDGVTIEPVQQRAETTASASGEQATSNDVPPPDGSPNPAPHPEASDTTGNPGASDSGSVSPDVITPLASGSVRAGPSVPNADLDNGHFLDPSVGRPPGVDVEQSVSDAPRGAVPSPHATSGSSTLDATLPVIDEIEVWP